LRSMFNHGWGKVENWTGGGKWGGGVTGNQTYEFPRVACPCKDEVVGGQSLKRGRGVRK